MFMNFTNHKLDGYVSNHFYLNKIKTIGGWLRLRVLISVGSVVDISIPEGLISHTL